MNVDSKIRFAIVGCGHIGKRHADMILNHTECELVAVCDCKDLSDIDSSALRAVPFFKCIEDLFNSSIDFDVMCIATPNGLHEQHALMGLKNQKHIVVEKPMCLTKAGCENIIYEALHQHKQVFCVMQNRYSPPSQWLKELLNKKVLGEIYMVQINCFWNRDKRYYTNDNWHGTKLLDGGTLFTQFSHFIDIMFWLFGDIKNIDRRLCSFNHKGLTEFEDSGFISFDFVNGGMGTFNYSTAIWEKNMESSITIISENGTVKVGGQYMNSVEYCNIKEYKMPVLEPSNPPNDYGNYRGSAANHHYVLQNVVDVLRGRASITTNALEGLKVVEIIERIYQAN